HTVDVAESGSVTIEGGPHLSIHIGQAGVDHAEIRHGRARARRGCAHTRKPVPRSATITVADFAVMAARPGTMSLKTAWSCLVTRTRCAAKFARRSSSSANTVVSFSGVTGVASPCRAATLARGGRVDHVGFASAATRQ